MQLQLQTSPVRFGDGTGLYVRNDADKAPLLCDMHKRFGARVPDQPGFRRWHRSLAREVRCGRFSACLQAAGSMLCYLYVAGIEGVGCVCAFVDRVVRDGHFYPRIVLARLGFAPEAYAGTLLEGELVRLDSGRHVFAIGDARAVCGAFFGAGSGSAAGVDLRGRLDAVRDLLARGFAPDLALDVCALRLKRFFSPQRPGGLRAVVRAYLLPGSPNALDYDVAAVVFKAVGGGHDPGTDVHFVLPRAHQRTGPAEASARGAAGTARQSAAGLQDGDGDGTSDGTSDGDEGDGGGGDDDIQKTRDVREFFVRATPMPDVYELHDTYASALASPGFGAQDALLAGVPSMKASAALRSARPGKPVAFELSAKFGKWVPLTD